MALTWGSKDPNEILDYSWRVPLDTGDIIVAHSASVLSGSVTISASRVAADLVTVDLVGGTLGETALFLLRATTLAGRTFEETAALPIVSSDYVVSSAETLQGYLLEARVARHKLATGANVVEVWRDGRRITYSKTTLSDLDAYIARLMQEIGAATAVATGGRTRSAIVPVYFN
jgi:gpW